MAAAQAIGFFGMLAKFYNAFGTVAEVISNTADAANNLALVGKIKSETFAKQAELEQQADLDELRRKIAAARKQDALLIEAPTETAA